jgi:TM2 domain-containing membrane protein YozV
MLGSQWGRLLGFAAALGITAVSLQGCTFEIPRHSIANWQKKQNYLNEYAFSAPGSSQTTLNSCTSSDVLNLQCNGHGKCVEWFSNDNGFNTSSSNVAPLAFCECDDYWADPECRTERKSQLTAFMLSLFFGMFGADQFYLGFWWPQGIIKLCTLGGVGFWWLYDLVRIGSTPVDTADNFRVAANVAHWAFVLILLAFFSFIGFALSIWSMKQRRLAKAREVLLLRSAAASEAGYGSGSQYGSRPYVQQGGFRGYATTLQA